MVSENSNESHLPATVAGLLEGLTQTLVPSCIKALDRLIGASMDLPVAWLGQQKAKIDAQTQSYLSVEKAIATAAANEVKNDSEIVHRAVAVLVRKEYRKQYNKDAIARAMLEDISQNMHEIGDSSGKYEIDDDWLNVFERYAEDASTERMQNLWGRVLSGEIRKPGKFSMRTLRFLSEFSQSDALRFAEFCENCFGDFAPRRLVRPNGEDVGNLIAMEAAGLIQGITGLALSRTFKFGTSGFNFTKEGDLYLALHGEPETVFDCEIVILTALGEELVALLPGRNANEAAKKVALAMQDPQIKSAFLGTANADGNFEQLEVLWEVDELNKGI